MFFGLYEHSLDDKNRVVLPLGLRRSLSEDQIRQGFVLLAGTRNRYLVMLPMREWASYERLLQETYDATEEEVQDYLIELYASANFVELDKQYRFAIPESSRQAAGIQRELCFVGMGTQILIFSKERWEEWQESRREHMAPPTRGRRAPPGPAVPRPTPSGT